MAGEPPGAHASRMTWYSVRLELARTPDFPLGSASRYYLLRLPLDDAGLIDKSALDEDPGRNTVRRFWPNEADMVGHLIPTRQGWAFSYRIGEDDDETIFHLETHPLRAGEYITLTEPNGQRLPFKVAAVTSLSGYPVS